MPATGAAPPADEPAASALAALPSLPGLPALADGTLRPAWRGGLPELSERQRAVLRRLLQGKANKVIARELDIAEGTVKAHLWSVYQVLGVTSRVQAMCRVHELGMLDKLG